MSSDTPETAAAAALTHVTDDHKKLIFSFIRMLRGLDSPNPDCVDAVAQLLETEYGVDPAGEGGLYDTEINLFDVFCRALRSQEDASTSQQDEKFKAFLELLVKKGYFAGTEPGTEEYASRLEKAKQKFDMRNNPYQGMTAEEIKNKGNECMGVAKYKEAIACYTKAIEMDPKNHIYFCNRAAAYTHLKDYRNSVLDCERAIAINPNYSKAYSRLGTSFFYQENYQRAVDAFTKACELDPTNERYKEDLRQAEEKVMISGNASRGANGMGGFPFDMSQIAQMMNNPELINAATRAMQNPQFSQMIANMAAQFGGAAPNSMDFSQLMGNMPSGMPDSGNTMDTPFGPINRESLEELRSEMQGNPRFSAIMEDLQQNGFAAFQKYLTDPEVMDLMFKFQRNVMGGGGNNEPTS